MENKIENKITVSANAGGKLDGTVRIGKDVVVLEDHTTHEFLTTSLADFVKFCKPLPDKIFNLYYSDNGIALFTKAPDRYTQATASCSICPSIFLNAIEEKLSLSMSLDVFEEFLYLFRGFMDDSTRTLFSYVKNFSASKITSIKRERDHKGNFRHLVTRANAGTDNVDIPETVTFIVPALDGVEIDESDHVSITLDLFMGWKDTDEGCKAYFKLTTPFWAAQKQLAIKSTVEKFVAELPFDAFWGNIKTIFQNDMWKYRGNNLDVEFSREVTR